MSAGDVGPPPPRFRILRHDERYDDYLQRARIAKAHPYNPTAWLNLMRASNTRLPDAALSDEPDYY